MYDIIVIGGGPSGLTSAIYALLANKSVLVIERESLGGQIVNASSINNYPGFSNISGADFTEKLYNQVLSLSGKVVFEDVVKISKDRCVYTNKNNYSAKSIIIATGLKRRKLLVDGEERLLGVGVSYCATCDGAFFKDKDVAVVGGGDTAVEDAIYLSNLARKVYLIHRRDSFRAKPYLVDKAKELDNIQFIYNSNVIKINGKDKVSSIIVEDSGHNKSEIEVDGLFIAIGGVPATSIFKDIIWLDSDGYIVSQDGVHTNIKGIYVAGDVREKKVRQLTTAVADGTVASLTAIREMEDNYGSNRN